MTAGDLEIRAPRQNELPGLVALLVTQLREHRVELPDAEIARAAEGMFHHPQRGRFLFSFTEGTPAELRSTPRARRTFCAACGTALTFQLTAQPSWVDVTVGSLDDPNAVVPDAHIWTTSQVSWLGVDDDLPRHPQRGPGG